MYYMYTLNTVHILLNIKFIENMTNPWNDKAFQDNY